MSADHVATGPTLSADHHKATLERGFTEAHIAWLVRNRYLCSLSWEQVEAGWLQMFPKAKETATGGLLLCFNPQAAEPTYSLRCDTPPTEERPEGPRPCKYLYPVQRPDFLDPSAGGLQPFVPNGVIGPDGEPFGAALIATEGLFDALACTLLLGVPCVGLTAPSHITCSTLPKGCSVYVGDCDQWLAPNLLQTVVDQCRRKQLKLTRLPLRIGYDEQYRGDPRDLPAAAKAGMEELIADLGIDDARTVLQEQLKAAAMPADYLRWEITQLKELEIVWPENSRAIENIIAAIASSAPHNKVKRDALKDFLSRALKVPRSTVAEGIKRRLEAMKARDDDHDPTPAEPVSLNGNGHSNGNGNGHSGDLALLGDAAPDIDRDSPSNQELQVWLQHSHVIRWNELKGYPEVDGQPFDRIKLAAQWLADVHGIQTKKESAVDAILYIAQSTTFNPIAEYLERVRTDPFLGRISTAQLAILFGIDPTDLISRELLCRHLGGQARRGLQPGCKYDHMGILVGPQGNGKTEAIRALSSPAWADGLGDTKKSLDDREVLAKVNGCWGFEIGECDRFLRGRLAAEIKDWLTYQTDCYCEKYQSIATDHPRRSAIWGTSNEDELLNDPTGSRRFWIIHTPNKIHWQGIGAQRDVIWASVLDWLDGGMPTFVDDADPLWKEVNQHIADRNKSHSVEDAWEDLVVKHLGTLRNTGVDFVTAAELLQHAVHVPTDRLDGKAMGRIGRIMQAPHFAALGWTKDRRRHNGIQQRGWLWQPPSPAPTPDPQTNLPGLP